MSAYLTEIGRKGGLKDWQFRQVVDALETMFCKVVVAPWADRFDWGYWKDSARSLEPHHATIARDAPLVRPSGPQDRQEADPGRGPVRGTHAEVLYALIAEIRRRAAYSIRTEQAYEHWACRFIAFCRNRDPRELGAAEGRGVSRGFGRARHTRRTHPCFMGFQARRCSVMDHLL